MTDELTVQCHLRWLWKFNTLLQKGVQVKCRVNQSLLALLKEDFQLDSHYISERIQTITLDGQPVDDPATAIVLPGSTLAVSGAMPGLVGATLRKGGYYAAMRSTISYIGSDKKKQEIQAGLVTVKLFNLILKDLAPAFLTRGIGVAGSEIVSLLDEGLELPPDEFGPVAREGKVLDWQTVREKYLKMELIFIRIYNQSY